MQERACDGARAGIEVFVRAPDGEIDVPIMQRQRHITDGMRKIDPDDNTALLGRRSDFWNIEKLAGEKVHTAEYHKCKLVCVRF